MKGGAYRHASLAKLLGEIAAPKVRSKSLNVVALEDLERRRLEAQAEAATSTLRDLTKRAQQKKLEADKSKAQGGAGAGGASKMLGASTLAVAGIARWRQRLLLLLLLPELPVPAAGACTTGLHRRRQPPPLERLERRPA